VAEAVLRDLVERHGERRTATAALGSLRLGGIKPRDVREYVEQLRRRQVKPSALAREILHLCMLFR